MSFPTSVAACVSGFVTTMSTTPTACAGALAVSSVALTHVTLVAATPPTDTVAPETKPLPVSFSEVPPALDPIAGSTAVSVGASRYSNAFASDPACRSVFVTEIVTLPTVPAGAVAEIVVASTTTTAAPALPPNATVAPSRKPVPVIETAAPPAFEPTVGVTALTVGAGLARYT